MKTGNAAFELADQLAEKEREAGVAMVRAAVSGTGETHCIDCGEAISPERRAALPSARRCIDCQMIKDRTRRTAA